MKLAGLALTAAFYALTLGLRAKLHCPLDDIENHDEFNVADVDGLGGFEQVEEAYRKRGLALPESMGGPKKQAVAGSNADSLAAKEMAARLRLL